MPMFIAYVYFYLENTINIFIELRNANTKTSKEKKYGPLKGKQEHSPTRHDGILHF